MVSRRRFLGCTDIVDDVVDGVDDVEVENEDVWCRNGMVNAVQVLAAP